MQYYGLFPSSFSDLGLFHRTKGWCHLISTGCTSYLVQILHGHQPNLGFLLTFIVPNIKVYFSGNWSPVHPLVTKCAKSCRAVTPCVEADICETLKCYVKPQKATKHLLSTPVTDVTGALLWYEAVAVVLMRYYNYCPNAEPNLHLQKLLISAR